MEQIDIGGPAMHGQELPSVTVVPSPEFYEEVLAALKGGDAPEETRRKRLALRTFGRSAAISPPGSASRGLEGETESPRKQSSRASNGWLRAGHGLALRENPHQEAAYYAEVGAEHLLSDR